MPYTYQYPRPAVTVDIIIIKNKAQEKEILLIERGIEPFKGMWALPGGFVEMDETLKQAAIRELKEETGLEDISLIQFKTYGDPNRDPRHRTISIVYYNILKPGSNPKPFAGDDASKVKWFQLSNLPDLAFDHKKIIHEAIKLLSLN